MFNLTASMNYYLYPYPTDMRKSFYTLSGIVTNLMERNVQDGDAFIFINRLCTSMKVLHMPKKKIDEPQDVSELKKEIHQLKASLVHSKMKNEALETMIDLAEKEFQIPIRKKSGAKQ